MTAFFAKIISFFMSILMALGITTPDCSGSKPFDGTASASIDFLNDEQGSAAGTVSVTSDTDGDYNLYWADSALNKLSVQMNENNVPYSQFATVTVTDGNGSTQIQSFTAIPAGAENVLLYKEDTLAYSFSLPQNKIADYGEKIYSFGALSDVHFNRYFYSLRGDDAEQTFPLALNFFKDAGVSLVGMSGDLSSQGEALALSKFNKIASKYDFPVYTTTGNHDVSVFYNKANWQKYINTGVYGEQKREGVKNVAANGMDFVYSPAAADGDVFIFLCQSKWDYGKSTSRLLTDEQLDWLQAQLEANKDSKVYLFFHTFIASSTNDPANTEGNLINSAGTTYSLVFTQGAPDEVRFRGLLQQYKNVVFFNGHSHWKYEMQKYNSMLNITDYNGTYATMVHISSVSSPRSVADDNALVRTENAMKSSEGMLVTVYADKIVLSGVEFFSGNILAYATYSISR